MPDWRFDGILDPETGIWFENDLRDVREEIVEDAQPPRNGFRFIPQDTDVAEWAETYEHRMFEPIGVAEFIANWADDLPLVDISNRAEVFNVRTFGCAYKFSLDEIAKSRATGMNLDRKRAMAARLITEQKFNRIMFFGDSTTQLFGLLNYPFAPRFLIPVSFDENSTPDAILNAMNSQVNAIFNLTETIGEPDFFGLPPAEYAHVSSRRIGDGTDTTILMHFENNNPFFKGGRGEVVPLHELKGAGPNGENVSVVYRRDPLVLGHKMVMEFRQLAPQERNLAILTNTWAKSGGIASDRPLEISIGEFPL